MHFKNVLVILFSLSVIALLSTGFRNGPANRGEDKTGSPLSSGTCLNCHSSGSYSPSLLVGLYDGDMEVTSYEPGKMYTLKYQLLNSGSPASFGFQTVALTAGNKSAGAFSNIPNGFRLINLDDANYVEHSSPRSLNTFEVNWTAPEDSNESITIYSGGVATNGNSSTGGDGASMDELVLEPNTSPVFGAERLENGLSLFDLRFTLVQDYLALETIQTGQSFAFFILDSGGNLLRTVPAQPIGPEGLRLDLANLPAGLYFIQGVTSGKRHTERFVKN
jgi:hypothetical protein